jgi:mRNA interferase RelE/StbE
MTWCGILAWTIELHPDAAKQLRELARRDKPAAKRVTNCLTDIGQADDPRSRGKGLIGALTGLWRYRVGDWRIVVDIHDSIMVVVALDIDHRSRVYR